MCRRSLNESSTRRALVALTALVALATAAESYAGPTPAQQCQSGKNKAAGKNAACRGNAEAKLAASGGAMKYGEAITKCADKFAATWQKLEDKAVAAGSACPSVGDATGIDGKVAATTDTIAALVGGVRFEDNGDGTVTDHQTGLQWEQKTNPDETPNLADPHDADNIYSLSVSGSPYPPDGMAFTDLLVKLNDCVDDGMWLPPTGLTGGFAGHCDWRLPTIVELQTILLTAYTCGTSPCIDPIFGPTRDNFYWSSTTSSFSPGNAWRVDFYDGYVENSDKSTSKYVRAVRGGS